MFLHAQEGDIPSHPKEFSHVALVLARGENSQILFEHTSCNSHLYLQKNVTAKYLFVVSNAYYNKYILITDIFPCISCNELSSLVCLLTFLFVCNPFLEEDCRIILWK